MFGLMIPMAAKMVKLSLLVVAFCALLAGCAVPNQQNKTDSIIPQTAQISDREEGRHYRTEQYAADFKVFTVTTGYGAVHMAQEIFDEKELQDAVLQIEEDLTSISEKTGGTFRPVELYLVEQTISGQPQSGAGCVYCTMEDIASGAYRQALVKEIYGLTMLWQNIGLSRFVFEKPIDESFPDGLYRNRAVYFLSLPTLFYPCIL